MKAMRSIINEELVRALQAGKQISVPDFSREVMLKYSEEYSAAKEQYSISGFHREVKNALKKMSEDDDSTQLRLPMIDLPSVIAIPIDGSAFVYRAAVFCTWEEVLAGGEVRDENMRKVQAKRDHYYEQIETLRPFMEGTSRTVGEAVEIMLGDVDAA
jgi:hypothetical protein